MTVIAVAILFGIFLRLILLFLDDGFGGPMWTIIYFSSSITWALAGILALGVLGYLPSISW